MALIPKPDVTIRWAENGNQLEPATEVQELGFVVEKPPYEVVNWLHNKHDTAVAYLYQEGFPDWDIETEYSNTSYVKYYGEVYRAKLQNIGKQPDINPENWELAFASYSDFKAYADDVDNIKNEDGFLTHYVQRNNPVLNAPAKGVSYNDSTGVSGLYFNSTTPLIKKNDVEIARFSELTSNADDSKNVATTEWVQSLLRSLGDIFAPTGSVVAMATRIVPDGYLECNGNTVSRTTYSRLFSVIGTTFGAGDGVSTFNLPDLRGQFVRGYDSGANIDQSRQFGSKQGDTIRNITASAFYGYDADIATRAPTSYTSGAFKYSEISQADNTNKLSVVTTPSAINWYPLTFDASLSVPTSTENRPKNVALVYMIKT